MVVKLYVSLISCSQEGRKNQQRATMILESKNIVYILVDITDPNNEDAKDYMVKNAQPLEGAKIPVTPQIFNEADYCGDFNAFDMANEYDTLGEFLKLTDDEKASIKVGITGIAFENKDNMTNSQSQELREGGSPEKETLEEVTIERETFDGIETEEVPINGENVTENTKLSTSSEAETMEETEKISSHEEGDTKEESVEITKKMEDEQSVEFKEDTGTLKQDTELTDDMTKVDKTEIVHDNNREDTREDVDA